MQQSFLPVCRFPSTAVFLDDNHDFLLNFVLQLDESVAYKTFDDAFAALQFINEKTSNADSITKHCLSESAQTPSETHRTIAIELDSIYKEIYNPDRFSEISVVIVDYAMPGMNGLEFCQSIKDKNIKKILLSGKADESLVIKAFNEGLIDRYIKKSDVDAAEQVTQSLIALQQDYFKGLSDTISSMLSVSSTSFQQSPAYSKLFEQLCVQNNIVEYYLLDNRGSFLLVDDDANTHLLVVKTKNDLEALALTQQKTAYSHAEVDKIKKGEQLPLNADDWSQGFVAANRLDIDGNQYYYALIEGAGSLPIEQKKILSYNRYLEELDAEALLTD